MRRLGGVKNTRLAVMLMMMESKDESKFWCADAVVAMLM
jgi:hypothetical protein